VVTRYCMAIVSRLACAKVAFHNRKTTVAVFA